MWTLFLACAPAPLDEAPGATFPYVYTPQADLQPYEEVRWETETWDPYADLDQTALYLQKAALHRPGAPEEELAHYAEMRSALPPLGAGTQVDFVGDVMWMGSNWAHFADPAAALLDGDLRVGNLESPTDPAQPTDKDELALYAFNAPPELLDGLPLDVLQLNNNHTLDVGDAGIEATVAEVEARGFAATGIDAHTTVSGIAFLSYTWGLNVRDVVSTHELFVVPFGHLDEPIDLDGVGADIAAARAAGAESVVLLLHWGFEYEYYPDPHFMVLARELITLGADLIVGEGPHVVQPPELCRVNQDLEPGVGRCALTTPDGEPRDAAILYSLGNFGSTMATAPCSVGLVASVTLDPDVTGLGWQAVANVDGAAGPEVHPAATVDDPDVQAELTRLRAHLGTSWAR